MRRARYVGVVVGMLLVVVVGAAMWWRWSSTRHVRGSPDSASSVPAPAPPTSELVLQINRTTAATISAGASVFFTVTVTGPAPEPWSSRLRFETGDGTPLALQIEPLGTPFTLQVGDGSRTDPRTAEGRTEASEMRQTELGISPHESARLSRGTQTIRAVLPLDARGPGELVSNTVTLTVGAPEAGTATSEKARLESAARFSLLSEKWEDAHRVALRLVEREDADAAAYIFLGDALNGLRRDDEALAAYHEALASLPRDLDESPDYLIARMEEVQQRLEAAKAKK
jgi:hypothetical protein